MKQLVLAVAALLACTRPAFAQSQVFVGGDMFADIKRFSGDPSIATLDGNAVGGGGRVGLLVAERWSISLAVDVGASTTTTRALPIGVLTSLSGSATPISLFQSRTTNRLVATSALLGYHAPAGHRVRPAVFGGLTFMHVTRRFDTTYPLPLAPPSPFPISSPLVIRPSEQVDNVPAATVGVEAAIELTSHFAAVPEVRAHAFSVSNGPSGFAIRPGLGVRWIF
jgi:hypothetical protein